jgi:hypothetical protein
LKLECGCYVFFFSSTVLFLYAIFLQLFLWTFCSKASKLPFAHASFCTQPVLPDSLSMLLRCSLALMIAVRIFHLVYSLFSYPSWLALKLRCLTVNPSVSVTSDVESYAMTTGLGPLNGTVRTWRCGTSASASNFPANPCMLQRSRFAA